MSNAGALTLELFFFVRSRRVQLLGAFRFIGFGTRGLHRFSEEAICKLLEEIKESKQEDLYSIGNCVFALEIIEELSVSAKAKALRLFKCPMNREIFINTKNPSLRLFWLKEEITAMERT